MLKKEIRLTVGGFNTFALSIFQESFFASASDDAVLCADRARMGIGACGWACSSARQENFVGFAFRDWWEHHERLNLSRAFAGLNAFSGIISEHSLFASASWFADTRAQGVGIFARTIATFALTEFFIFLAWLDRWEHNERFWLDLSSAFTGLNAFTSVIT